MRKFSVLAAVALVAAGLVTGCGSSGDGGSSSGYCSQLKASAETVKSFTVSGSTPDFSKFSEFLDQADKLAAKAPSEVKADWKTLLGAMDTLVSALDDAGIKLEDMGTLMSGQLPEGVDASKLAELGTKLQEIGSEKVTKAGEAIRTNAKEKCGVDLGKIS